jgi:hypothetical protein
MDTTNHQEDDIQTVNTLSNLLPTSTTSSRNPSALIPLTSVRNDRKRKQTISLPVPEPLPYERAFHDEASRHLLRTTAARPHKPPPKLPKREIDPPHLAVGLSTIPAAKNGLFTLKEIRKGTRICAYYGDRVKSLTARKADYKSDVCFEVVGTDSTIDPQIPDDPNNWQCLAAYINDPLQTNKDNCEFHINPTTFAVTIVSTQNIKPYQELFLPYGKFYWNQIPDTNQPLYDLIQTRYAQDQLDEDPDDPTEPRKRKKPKQTTLWIPTTTNSLSADPTSDSTTSPSNPPTTGIG